ncbi:MAG: hypothetical protein ACLQLG_01990 [Thermoguttaceae bacterium]
MVKPDIYFVHLRRPKNSGDQRADPFYEVGSFGCTGCHSWNLLHPRNAHKLKGARLAFVQGADDGTRLVLLTPPITVVKRWMKYDKGKGKWVRIREVKWKPTKPLKYDRAPILIRNDGYSDLRLVMTFALDSKQSAEDGRLLSPEQRLGSKLRTNVKPLSTAMAKQVIKKYESLRKKALAGSGLASSYEETMSPPPKNPDTKRKVTYRKKIQELVADLDDAEGADRGQALIINFKARQRGRAW